MTDRPVVLVVPGFLRLEVEFAALTPLLEPRFEVAFWRLPAHATPSLPTRGVRPIAEALELHVRSAFAGREVVLVGESLSGLVALILAAAPPPEVKTVLAFDPPFQTRKLWPVHETLRRRWAEHPNATVLKDYGEPVFGHPPSGELAERDYRDVLNTKPMVPVQVVTGDVPLMPVRPLAIAPTLMDDEDRRLVAQAEGYDLQVLEGDLGHTLLALVPERCAEIITQAYRRAGGRAPV